MYVIKHKPEDFVVEEIASPRLKEDGSHAILKVTKRGMNTDDVARLLAERLRVSRRDVGYAGAKDRNAVTTQHFSVKGLKKDDVGVSISGLEIEFVGRSGEAIGLGALEGNRFAITIRNLEGDEDLSLPESIPNYFDAQRFGTNNAEIGRALLKKDFKRAVDLVLESQPTERRVAEERLAERPGDAVGALMALPRNLLRMYLHAYQSLLWNRAVAKYVEANVAEPEQTGIKKITYSLGDLVFPPRHVLVPRAAIPMPGFGSPSHPLVDVLLKEEGFTPRDFVIRQLPNLSLEGDMREAVVAVKDFTASAFEDDEEFAGKKKATLTFSLPKGSYATMVVKAIMGY